jgi:xanthine dehydrogenase accessory factor
MKELQEILKKINSFAPGEKAILATVVDVVGSGYRRPGARMLIDANGYAVGTVSGGCLEADVLERAKKVLETGEPTVITYDTTKGENSVFGLGMGCRGVVRILLEPISPLDEYSALLSEIVYNRQTVMTATLIADWAMKNSKNVGRRWVFDNKGVCLNLPDFMSKSKNGGYFFALQKDIESALKQKKSFTKSYSTSFGELEFFVETLSPPLVLLIFGVGFDALPLVKFAKELGWRVTAIDHRPAYANAERLAEADEIIVSGAEDLSDDLFADENSVAVVMTHNYDRDREILRRLLNSKCRYVGALGPKKRTERLLAEIGENFSWEQLAKLHAPVGLDIGAESPVEIALAIVAEIQAVLSGRQGGFLRERNGGIH